jgi:hemerythrin-like domain-containing protein
MIITPAAIARMLIVFTGENVRIIGSFINPVCFFFILNPQAMSNKESKNSSSGLLIINPRRDFLRTGVLFGTLAGVTGISLISSCKKETADDEISPVEDLMREHGILNRIMMIYDNCRARLTNKEEFQVDALTNSANIIRSFVEDYHEKLEEKYLFPRFVNANKLVDLVQTLYIQHHAGRILTDQILKLANSNSLKNPDDTLKMINFLDTFNRMYRVHEAREDTVLFPNLRKIVSRNEYDSMGEDFEEQERKLFGADGFEGVVDKVASIEKQLGIYDISSFTPAV